jgi:hypothetical protein
MAVFLISYDLIREDTSFDYVALGDELKRLGAVRSHFSEWLASLNNTAEEVFDHFATFIDSNDRLMVIKITERPSWNTGLKGTRAFIDEHFPA